MIHSQNFSEKEDTITIHYHDTITQSLLYTLVYHKQIT